MLAYMKWPGKVLIMKHMHTIQMLTNMTHKKFISESWGPEIIYDFKIENAFKDFALLEKWECMCYQPLLKHQNLM